jgi:hypothetical protein
MKVWIYVFKNYINNHRVIFGNCNPNEGGNVNISWDLKVLGSFGLKIPKVERDLGHQSSHLNYHIEGMFKKIILKKKKVYKESKFDLGLKVVVSR